MSKQDELNILLHNYSRRLQKLKEIQSLKGINTEPETLLEIEDIEEQLAQLEIELQKGTIGPGDVTPSDLSNTHLSPKTRILIVISLAVIGAVSTILLILNTDKAPFGPPRITFSPTKTATELVSITITPNSTSVPTTSPAEALSPNIQATFTSSADVISLDLVRTFQAHSGDVSSVAFSPDGKLLASTSQDGTTVLLNISNGGVLYTLEGHTHGPWSVNFSPDGELLAVGGGDGDDTVLVWKVSDGSLRHTLKGHTGGISKVVFSPNGVMLASGAIDNTVRIWDVADGKLLHVLQEKGWINGLAFSPDGNILASVSDEVRLWQVSDWSLLKIFHGMNETPSLHGVAFTPNGAILASGAFGGTSVYLWRTSDGELLDTLVWHINKGARITDMSFSPDGNILVLTVSNNIHLWDIRSRKPLFITEVSRGSGVVLAYSPNGQLIALGLKDGSVQLWQVLE
ncbi:MAG: WD40 repeat domain-containing protein [Anaerolineales bacterium]|nr:WD40 repeat domain-containing protein [Anaerolineales bacterium]